MTETLGNREAAIFETMSVPKAVASLAIPTIISQLVTIIYNLADTWYIGQTGDTNQVAAVTIAYPVFMTMTAIANLFGIGGGSLISRSLGAKDYDKAKCTSAFSFWAAIIVTLLISICAACTRAPLLTLLGADESTLAFCSDYVLWVVIIGGIPTVLNMLLAHLVRAVGASKQASIGMSLGGILNVILDPIFIFQWGFGMNVAGAALATCISNTVATCYFLRFVLKKKNNSILSLSPKNPIQMAAVAGPVISIGLPSALQTFLAVVSNVVLNNLMSAYSAAAVAAVGIVKKADLFPAYVVQGLSNGVLPLLAYNYASGNRQRMNKAAHFSLTVSLVFTGVCLVCYEIFAPGIVRIFIADETTISYGASFMRLHCMAMPFLSIIFLLTVLFQAAGQSRQAMVLSLLRKGAIDIPLMIIMNFIWPMMGIMSVQPFLDFSCAVLAFYMYLMFFRNSWPANDKPL